MKKYFWFLAILFFIPAAFLRAQVQNTDGYMPDQSLREYFAASDNNYDKSIIYVFFNNQPCYTCAAAIEMVEDIYNNAFIDRYNMFLINYADDEENDFINTYQLSKPLEVVLVRINDGASFGYQKLENLENMTSDPVSFKDYFINQVNNFLGNQ